MPTIKAAPCVHSAQAYGFTLNSQICFFLSWYLMRRTLRFSLFALAFCVYVCICVNRLCRCRCRCIIRIHSWSAIPKTIHIFIVYIHYSIFKREYVFLLSECQRLHWLREFVFATFVIISIWNMCRLIMDTKVWKMKNSSILLMIGSFLDVVYVLFTLDLLFCHWELRDWKWKLNFEYRVPDPGIIVLKQWMRMFSSKKKKIFLLIHCRSINRTKNNIHSFLMQMHT